MDSTRASAREHFNFAAKYYELVSRLIKAGAALLYALLLPRYRIGLYNDDAVYVIVAQDLWKTSATHPLLGVKPDFPMPGLPLLLAPFVDWVRPFWERLEWLSLAATVASIFLIERLCRRWLSKTETLVAMAVFAFNPVIAKFSGVVMTAPYYSVFILGSFVLLGELLDAATYPTALVLGFVLGWAALLRPEGVLLALAIVIGIYVSSVDGKKIVALMLPLVGWLAFFIFWFHAQKAPRTEFSSDISALANYWPRHLGSIIPMCFKLPQVFLFDSWWALKYVPLRMASVITAVALVALAGFFGVGFRHLWRSRERQGELAIVGAFVVLYFSVHVFWHVAVPRYIVPIFPLFIIFAVRGGTLSIPKRRPRWAVAVMTCLFLSYAYENGYALYRSYATKRTGSSSPMETIEWIRVHTEPSARMTSSLAPVIDLYTGRQAVGQIKVTNADFFYYVLLKNNLNYIMVNFRLLSVTPGVGETDNPNLVWTRYRRWVRLFPKRFPIVYVHHDESTQVNGVVHDVNFLNGFDKFIEAVGHFEAGRYAESFDTVSEALSLYPDMGCARNLLGALYLFQGKQREAEKAFLEAVRCLPDSSFEALNLATLYHRQGKTDLATDYIRKGLEISTLNKEQEAYLENARMLQEKWEMGRATLFIDSPDPKTLAGITE